MMHRQLVSGRRSKLGGSYKEVYEAVGRCVMQVEWLTTMSNRARRNMLSGSEHLV